MVDLEMVCCMCGDVGFRDKLFRCNKCRHRYQHSYCSNFAAADEEIIQECDWCQTEAAAAASKKNTTTVVVASSSSTAGDKMIMKNCNSEKRKSPVPSPRHATRRYKLLKDVMC